MGYSFDGDNKIITLTSGTTLLDVRDLYSRWKDWVISATYTGSRFLQAFTCVGGDPIDEANGIYVTSYFFLMNGWRVRPQEADHTLKVWNGVLLTLEGEEPFIQTTGPWNVLVLYSQPVKSETIILETGISGLTEEESTQLFKTLTTPKFIALK